MFDQDQKPTRPSFQDYKKAVQKIGKEEPGQSVNKNPFLKALTDKDQGSDKDPGMGSMDQIPGSSKETGQFNPITNTDGIEQPTKQDQPTAANFQPKKPMVLSGTEQEEAKGQTAFDQFSKTNPFLAATGKPGQDQEKEKFRPENPMVQSQAEEKPTQGATSFEKLQEANKGLANTGMPEQGKDYQVKRQINPFDSIADPGIDKPWWEDLVDGVSVGWKDMKANIAGGIADLADMAPSVASTAPTIGENYAMGKNPRKFEDFKGAYNEELEKQARGESTVALPGLKEFAKKEHEKARKRGEGTDQESWGYFIGSLIPQTAGIATAVGVGAFNPALGTAIGMANMGGLGAMAMGAAANEYDEYIKAKNEGLRDELSRRFPGSVSSDGKINEHLIPEEARSWAKPMEFNPNDKLATMLLSYAIESGSEAIPVAKFIPKAYRGRMSKFIFGSTDNVTKQGRELLEEFAKSKASRGQLIKNIGREALEGMLVEGGSETFAEVGGEFATWLYKEKDDRGDWEEIVKSAAMGFAGGALMGAAIGPMSYGSQSYQNRKRRQENGKVILSQDTESGEVLEILGVSNPNTEGGPQDGTSLVYQAVRPNGKVVEVSEDQLNEVFEFKNSEFDALLKGKQIGQAANENQANEELSNEALNQIQEIRAQYEPYTFTDPLGNKLIAVGKLNGEQVFINQTVDEGLVITDQNGEKKIVPKDALEDVQSLPFDQFMESVSPVQADVKAPFDPERPVTIGEQINFQGENWAVTGVDMDSGTVQLELMEGDGVVFETIGIEEFQALRPEQKPISQPEGGSQEKPTAGKLRDIFNPKKEQDGTSKENEPGNIEGQKGSQDNTGTQQLPDQDGAKESGSEGSNIEIQGAIGQTVRYQGRTGTLQQAENGQFEIVSGKRIFEIPSEVTGNQMTGDLGIEVLPQQERKKQPEKPKTKPESIQFDRNERTVSIDGQQYTINTNELGNIASLSYTNENGEKRTTRDPNIILPVEIERNKSNYFANPSANKVQDLKNEIVNDQDNDADENIIEQVDRMLSLNMTEQVESVLDGNDADEGGMLQARLWLEDAIQRIETFQAENQVSENQYINNLKENLYEALNNITAETDGNIQGKNDDQQPTGTKPGEGIAEGQQEGEVNENGLTPEEQVKFDALGVRQVPKGPGSWRDEFNKSTNPMRKADILEAVAEIPSTTEKELQEILKVAKGMPFESRIKYAVDINRQRKEDEQARNQDGQDGKQDGQKDELQPQDGKEEVIEGSTPEVNRKKGFLIDGSGVRHDRQQPLEVPKGKNVNIEFAKGVDEPGTFAVIGTDQIQPSHRGGNRNPVHFIPEAQPKDRSSASSLEAAQVIALNLDPSKIGQSPNAYSGSPIVNSRGEVIQGNNRTDAILNYWQNNPEDTRGYKKYLMDNAADFGLNPSDIEKMDRPILVRMVNSADPRAIELGNYDVKDTESGGKRRIDAKQTLGKLNKQDRNRLLNILFQGQGKTPSEIIREQYGAIANLLYKANAINSTQLEAIENKTTGEVNKQGVEDLSNLFMEFLFEGGSTELQKAFDNLPVKIQNGLQKALPNILRAKNPIVLEIQNAILALADYEGYQGTISEWISQINAFAPNPVDVFGELPLEIAKKLDSLNQNAISDLFNEYYRLTSDIPADMFSPGQPGMSTAQAIEKIFNVKNYEAAVNRGRKEVLDGQLGEGGQVKEGVQGGDKAGQKVGNTSKISGIGDLFGVDKTAEGKRDSKQNEPEPTGGKGVDNVPGSDLKAKTLLGFSKGSFVQDLNTGEVFEIDSTGLNEVTLINKEGAKVKVSEKGLVITDPKNKRFVKSEKPSGWKGKKIETIKEVLDPKPKDPSGPREMIIKGDFATPKDGKGIGEGDTFLTNTGRTTTPYPKTSKRFNKADSKKASEWLIDNAVKEAKSRGDDFNENIFKNTTILSNGELTKADADSLSMYLFDPSWKNIGVKNKPKPQTPQWHKNAIGQLQKKLDLAKAFPTEGGRRSYWTGFYQNIIDNLPINLNEAIAELEKALKAVESDKTVFQDKDQLIKDFKGLIDSINPNPKQENKQGKEYKFELLLRPFSQSNYPKDAFVRFEQTPGSLHGHIVLNRPLTTKEIQQYEVSAVDQVEEIKGKAFKDKDGYYSRIEIDWTGGSNRFAVARAYDMEGDLVESKIEMSAVQVLQNIEEGYWTEIKDSNTETEESLRAKYEPKSVEELTQIKKDKYSNVDIATPKSLDEKILDRVLAEKFSKINSDIQKKNQEKKRLSEEAKKKEQELNNLFDDFFNAGKGKLTSGGFNADQIVIAGKIIAKAAELGYVKFQQVIAWANENIGPERMKEYFNAFKGAYVSAVAMNGNPNNEDLNSLAKLEFKDLENVKLNEEGNVSDQPGDGKQNSQNNQNEVQGNEGIVPGDRRNIGNDGRKIEEGNNEANPGQPIVKGSGDVLPDFSGNKGYIDIREEKPDPSPGIADDNAGIVDGRGNRIDGAKGSDVDRGTNGKIDPGTKSEIKQFGKSLAEKREAQKKAESIPNKRLDLDNIRETLPYLLPDQQMDVFKAETRFFGDQHQGSNNANGKGILFTNGTGTGKTYTGLGIIKRFLKDGKKNILILTPSQKKVSDWIEDGQNLGITVSRLDNTNDNGKNSPVVMTSFANFRANESLKDRDWDLIVYDESHRIMESKDASQTSTTVSHFKNANINENWALQRLKDSTGLWKKENELNDQIRSINKRIGRDDTMDIHYFEGRDEIKKLEQEISKIRDKQNEILPSLEKRAKEGVQNTKVVFLSATPFKAHFNLDYAQDVLFPVPKEGTKIGYSRVDPRSKFYLDNFGSAYEWKYHRLQTKSDANPAAIAMQETQFAENMMGKGVMSGRAIDSDKDYARHFPLVTGFNSDIFNTAVADIFNYRENEFDTLREHARSMFFEYNYTTQLLESMKASASIPRIEKHIEMGRKVVVFHRRKQANIQPPFQYIVERAKLDAKAFLSMASQNNASQEQIQAAQDQFDQAEKFAEKYKDLMAYEQTLDYRSAVDQFKAHFGDQVKFFNGDVSNKNKEAAVKEFNDDTSNTKIIVIQEESGKEGISLHDTTGKHQRVLMSLSMPISSITALQVEGRIYRIGNQSNAVFEYPLLGLDTELAHFGQTLNKRVSTTENLAMGNASRDLLKSFSMGVLNSEVMDPNENQGIGGKDLDRRMDEGMSEFQKAILYYDSNQKLRGKRDQREGLDYFPTPEPIGQKMMQWLKLKPAQKALEPSAGKGSIAMWSPSDVNLTAIEPSMDLYSKLGAATAGADVRNMTFEELNIINKYDGIAMNPPFGQGGKLAMDHLEKAFKHLPDGGRVVALLPSGPSMDKRLDKFFDPENKANKGIYMRAEISLPSSTFVQAGTGVSTKIYVFDKVINPADPNVNLGYVMKPDLRDVKNIKELFEEIEFLDVPDKIEIAEKAGVRETAEIAETMERIFGGDLSAADKKIGAISPEGGVTYQLGKHTKTGEDLHLVKMNNKFSDEDYSKLKSMATKFGKNKKGFYDKWSKAFRFESENMAKAFVNAATGQGDPAQINELRTEVYGKKPSGKTVKNQGEFVRAEVEKITSTWRNAPEIEVFDTVSDLYEAYPNVNFGIDVDKTAAFFYNNADGQGGQKIILMANHPFMGRSNGVAQAVIHESIGHFGIRGFVKSLAANKQSEFISEFNSVLQNVFDAKSNDPEMNRISQMYFGKDVSQLTQQEVFDVAEEFLAHEAHRGVSDSWMDRAISDIVKLLRKLGMNIKMTDMEIRELIGNGRRYVENGTGSFRQKSNIDPTSHPVNNNLQKPLYIGSKANINEGLKNALSNAKNLIKEGASMEKVWRETGWFKDAKDGEWKYEIDDFDSFFKGIDTRAKLTKLINGGKFKLGQIFNHAELFRAYPELRSIDVELIHKDSGQPEGAWVNDKNLIQVRANTNNPTDVKFALLHELQHSIQDEEGFAQGGSQKLFDTNYRMGNIAYRMQMMAERMPLGEMQELIRGSKSEAIRWFEANTGATPFDRGIIMEVVDILSRSTPSGLKNILFNDRLTPFQKYQALAGEVEARNVTERMGMNAEQRSETAPWTNDDASPDQVIVSKSQQAFRKEMELSDPNQVNTVTETPEFKAWFGDSKVVDEKGNPLVVYHGTNKNFNEFDPSKQGSNTGWNNTNFGFFFIADKNLAENFARENGGGDIIMPTYLSLQNPIDLTLEGIFKNEKQAPIIVEALTNEKMSAKEALQWLDEEIGLGEVVEMRELLENPKSKELFVKNGFDGVISNFGDNIKEYVAFNPTQIKSATNNQGTFDPLNPDIRFLKVDGSADQEVTRIQSMYDKAYDRWINFREKYQDNMITAKKLIQKKKGMEKVSDSSNFYVKENLAKGKTLIQTERFMKDLYDPLITSAKEMNDKFNVTVEEIGDYLMALHAPERNAKIKEEKPDIDFDPSGISDAEAAKIVEAFESKVTDRDLIDKMIGQVRDMNDFVNWKRFESGMITEEVYEQLTNMYDNYVPLRGWEDFSADDLSVYSPLKKAMGRKSKAFNPIPFMVTAAQDAIMKGENNKVRQSLLEFVKENPSPGEYQIRNAWYVKTDEVDETGETIWVETMKRPTKKQIEAGEAMRSFNPQVHRSVLSGGFGENVVPVMVNGKRAFVEFKDKAIPMAIKNMSATQTNDFLNKLRAYTRWLSSMYTQYSPEFGVRNLIRDMGFGTFNIIADNDVKTAAKTIKGLAKSSVTLGHYFHTEKYGKGEDMKMLKEFMDEGALTGYSDLRSVKDIFANAQKEVDKLNQQGWGAIKTMGSKGIEKMLMPLDVYNRTLENAMRFSYYKVLREQGVSKQKAAAGAKDLTVNFNRKGNETSFWGSIYIFFNAAVQGNERLLRNFKDPKTRKKAFGLMGGLMAAGLSQSVLLGMLAGDDDDNESYYSKIPDYIRRTHIVIPNLGTNEFIKIPLPYGVNLFWAAGESIGSVLTGGKDPGNEAMGLLTSATDSFSPIGGYDFDSSDLNFAQKLLKLTTPSTLQPIADLAVNRDFKGSRIYREPFTKGQLPEPNSQSYFPGVNPLIRELTSGLNRITGGDDVIPGKIDINPEWIEYGVENYFGGPASFFKNLGSTVMSALEGDNILEDPNYKRLPFVRNYRMKVGSQYQAQQSFYENVSDANRAATIFDRYKAKKDPKANEYLKDNRDLIQMSDAAKSFQKSIKDINSGIEYYTGLEKSPERQKKLDELYDKRAEIYTKYNKVFNQKVKGNKVSGIGDLF
jgi:hypothetical protein